MEETQSFSAAAEERLEQVMEGIRRAHYADDAIQRAVDEQPDLASKIVEEVRLEQQIRGGAPAPIPESIGHYQIQGKLDGGGMGWIYRGYDSKLYRHVAIKTIRRDRQSEDLRAKFLREQRILAKLHETRIIPIYDSGTFEFDGGTEQYYVMPLIPDTVSLGKLLTCAKASSSHRATPRVAELVRQAKSPNGWRTASQPAEASRVSTLALEGASSVGDAIGGRPHADHSVRRSNGALPKEEVSAQDEGAVACAEESVRRVRHSKAYLRSVAKVLSEVAAGLHFAHSKGIFHCDCKPDNILVNPDEDVFILDFGLARVGRAEAGVTPEPPHWLAEGEFTQILSEGTAGTPEYMAPEQFLGTADARTDVWALGATLYELLTFRKPFGTDREQVMRRVTTEPLPEPTRFANIPEDLAAICRKTLQKQPGERYRSAAELSDDLRRWLDGFPTLAHPAGALRTAALWARRNRGWAAAIGAALVASFSVAGVEVEQSKESRRDASIQKLQRIRLTRHQAGWFAETFRIAGDAAGQRRDQLLLNQAVACLAGIDATQLKQWDFDGSSAAFDATGATALLGGFSSGARLWNAQTDVMGDPVALRVGGVAFDSEGHGLAWTSESPWSFVLWSTSERKTVLKVEAELPVGVARPVDAASVTGLWARVRMAMSGSGALMAASVPMPDDQGAWTGDRGDTAIWDRQGNVVCRVAGMATSLCFSQDDLLVAAGHDDGRIDVISLADGKVVAALRQSRNCIRGMDFAKNPVREGESTNWLLAAADAGGTVTVWDVGARQVRSHCRGSNHGVFAVRFSPDGMTLASGGRGDVKLWNYQTGELLLQMGGTGDFSTGLAFSPDGSRLLTAGEGYGKHFLTLWRIEAGHGITDLRGLTSPVAHTCLSADGRLLAVLGDNWDIAIFDTHPARLRSLVQGPRGYFADNAALALSPDNRLLAVSSGTEAMIFDIRTSTVTGRVPLPPGLVDQLAFTADGNRLLSFRKECQDGRTAPMSDAHPAAFPRVLRIRDLLGHAPTEPIAEITRFNWHVFCAFADPEGRLFVADGIHKGPDGDVEEITAFDGLTGAPLWVRARRKIGQNGFLAIDPAGTTLAYTSDEGGSTTHLCLPSGKTCGKNPGIAFAVAARGDAYVAHGEQRSSVESEEFALFREGQPHPCLSLATDFRPSATSIRFSRDGRFLVMGTHEGVTLLCDLFEIERKVIELGFPRRAEK